MVTLAIPKEAVRLEPLLRLALGLLDQRAHRQAINEAAGPVVAFVVHAVPEPGEDDGGGFAQAGRDRDELRFTFATGIPTGETTLVVVGTRVTGGCLEKRAEGRDAHRIK